jgi:hypothetical protein
MELTGMFLHKEMLMSRVLGESSFGPRPVRQSHEIEKTRFAPYSCSGG